MAGKGVKSLGEAMRTLSLSSHSCSKRIIAPSLVASSVQRRSMATEVPAPNITRSATENWKPTTPAQAQQDPTTASSWGLQTTVPVTIYNFPSLEPLSVESWSTKHLHLPLRRDILHLAVVYEGDKTRQGTASSKTRYDVTGSRRKVRPQKGTGSSRAADRYSPLFRGGGKTFGPHPRDFSTRLNRKVYDLAWRTALSYRYRRGELFVVRDGLELPLPDDFLALAQRDALGGAELEDGFVRRYVRETLGALEWGRASGRTLFVTGDRRPNLFTSLEVAGEDGRALVLEDVDVKDLLETGRVVIERSALAEMIKRHRSDLVSRVFIEGSTDWSGPPLGQTIVEATP